MSGVTLPKIPLGRVVAERHFVLWDSEGREREIVVKLGAPVQPETETGLFRCPAQILGLGVDQIVYDPAGEDAFMALCYALDLIGQVLEGESESLHLQNRYKTGETRETRSPTWVWQYMDHPNGQTQDCTDAHEADRYVACNRVSIAHIGIGSDMGCYHPQKQYFRKITLKVTPDMPESRCPIR